MTTIPHTHSMSLDSFGAAPVDLAERHFSGVTVLLLWDRRSGRLWIDVIHLATGHSFIVDATPQNALEVFYHPFAYGSFAESLLRAIGMSSSDDEQRDCDWPGFEERAPGTGGFGAD